MKALGLEPKVISLANTLLIHAPDAVIGIRDFCTERVQKFIRSAGSVSNIAELQKLVCKKLNLTIHEIWSDDDLQRVTDRYLADDERVFAFMRADLNAGTYGVLVRLLKRVGNRFAWVALVDCRGDKRHRRFFTAWHEIVHCITSADQYELPFHRTIIGRKFSDPVEKLVDLVAGELGFYDPLFRPHLERELRQNGRLTFASVERIREQFCSDASFEATLNACVARLQSPLVFLKAGLVLKNKEQAEIDSRQQRLFRYPAPQPQLRVVSTIRNGAARKASLHIPHHFRVPPQSVIAKVHSSTVSGGIDFDESETLSHWTSSDGTQLPPINVDVTARKMGDQVFALLSTAVGK
jgi:hypothetical protein